MEGEKKVVHENYSRLDINIAGISDIYKCESVSCIENVSRNPTSPSLSKDLNSSCEETSVFCEEPQIQLNIDSTEKDSEITTVIT